jgi:hypothetical protein
MFDVSFVATQDVALNPKSKTLIITLTGMDSAFTTLRICAKTTSMASQS